MQYNPEVASRIACRQTTQVCFYSMFARVKINLEIKNILPIFVSTK